MRKPQAKLHNLAKTTAIFWKDSQKQTISSLPVDAKEKKSQQPAKILNECI